jgi:hypothetical protein
VRCQDNQRSESSFHGVLEFHRQEFNIDLAIL